LLEADVSKIIGSYNLILAQADNNHNTTPAIGKIPTVGDYTNVGVNVTAFVNGANTVSQSTSLHLFNDVVSGLASTQVDSIADLGALNSVIGKILTMAANPKTTGAAVGDYLGLTQSDMSLLGLKGGDGALANTSNVSNTQLLLFEQSLVQATVDNGTVVDDFSKLQTLLSNIIINNAVVVLS